MSKESKGGGSKATSVPKTLEKGLPPIKVVVKIPPVKPPKTGK